MFPHYRENELNTIYNKMERINMEEKIGNYDKFGPLTNDTIIIVIQVSNYEN